MVTIDYIRFMSHVSILRDIDIDMITLSKPCRTDRSVQKWFAVFRTSPSSDQSLYSRGAKLKHIVGQDLKLGQSCKPRLIFIKNK